VKRDWLRYAVELSKRPADFYCGCRKIHRGVQLSFDPPSGDLQWSDAGYSLRHKRAQLMRHYYHEASIKVAAPLWDERVSKRKYGLVSFTCFAHFTKTEGKTSPRASVMGPCLQSVVLTWIKGKTEVDVFYRTTEFFKKFPADLVFLRDELLPNFDFKLAPIDSIEMHYANTTCHPMYFGILLAHFDDPIKVIDSLREPDHFFWQWVVKWTARYTCPEYAHGVDKWAQAVKVRDTVVRTMEEKGCMDELNVYFRKHHPGTRGGYG